MMLTPRSSLLKILLFVLVAVLVLCVGLWLFLPWDMLWDKALRAGLEQVSGTEASWERVSDASPLRFTIKNLDVTMKNTRLHVSEARVGLGLSPLITAHLDTAGRSGEAEGEPVGATPASPLRLRLFRGKMLTVDGTLDLAGLVPDMELAGRPGLDADLKWKKWPGLPASGSLELSAEEITLPNGIRAQGLELLAVLARESVTIRNFEVSGPIPLRLRGAARLDRKNLLNTAYKVKGSLFPKGAALPFQRSGRLGEFF